MSALTIIIPALIVAATIIYASVLVHAWRHWDGQPSRDRHDWQGRGLTDPDCPAPHPTNYFAESETTK